MDVPLQRPIFHVYLAQMAENVNDPNHGAQEGGNISDKGEVSPRVVRLVLRREKQVERESQGRVFRVCEVTRSFLPH